MTTISGLGQLDILKMLAAKGGNLGMVDHRGDSAIYWAARQGHEDIIRYLLSQGVHLNQQNKVFFCLFPSLGTTPNSNGAIISYYTYYSIQNSDKTHKYYSFGTIFDILILL